MRAVGIGLSHRTEHARFTLNCALCYKRLEASTFRHRLRDRCSWWIGVRALSQHGIKVVETLRERYGSFFGAAESKGTPPWRLRGCVELLTASGLQLRLQLRLWLWLHLRQELRLVRW